MPAAITLGHLRRYAVSRSLFKPTSLNRAIQRLGFVQADPIRAPARAQDLTLRHRVKDYRAGDLERRYAKLGIEEDFFINYGFLSRATQQLMHPRTPGTAWPKSRWKQAEAVLEFIRERGVVHPQEVDAHFQHGKVKNWFGGSSNASTQLLDGMHFRGMVRTARREGGIRLYGVRPAHAAVPDPDAAMDSLVDVVLNTYAPLPQLSLNRLISRIRYGAPQWEADQRHRSALKRACARLPATRIDGIDWYWPAGENPASRRHGAGEAVHLLAPFDPVVWDRRRFELFWGWAYRFEAYTPPAKRIRGYYALPLLWREQVIGWGNVALLEGRLQADFGYVTGAPPRDAGFQSALEDEMQRMHDFLVP